MAIYPIFFHGNPGEGMDMRFDTTMMPNGSIAVLSGIAKELGYDNIAVDEGFLGGSRTAIDVLTQIVEQSLQKNMQPVILATLLSYNASTTLPLLDRLKSRFGKSIRVGVGGQLTRISPGTYLKKSFLDHVAVGDAEATLSGILKGQRFLSSYAANGNYALPDYDNYWALDERLAEMSRYKLGPFSQIRQLTAESVRGCAWAYTNQTCDMCSLQGVELKPQFLSLEKHFELEKHLSEKWNANWVFDVSNQWLPTIKKSEMLEWLRNYCRQRINFLGDDGLNKYVYLTANSITPETAPLLRRAGIRIAYIGFDGWDKQTLTALHKSQPPIRKVLQICRDNDLHVRTSMVIGNGVNSQNIWELPAFVGEMIGEFGDIIRSWGNFIQIVLPGSPVFAKFKTLAEKNDWKEAKDLFRNFEENGFFTWSEQSRLNELFIRLTQKADYDQLLEVRNLAEEIVAKSAHTVGVTIEHGGQLK